MKIDSKDKAQVRFPLPAPIKNSDKLLAKMPLRCI